MTALGIVKCGFAAFAGVGTVILGGSWLVRKRLGALARFFLVGMVVGCAGILDAYLIEPNWIQVHEVIIHDRALAQVVGDTKIVHISDIHLNEGIGFRERQLVAKVNALRPDIIFVTGDFIDDMTQVGPAKELIGELRASAGIFGVAGNTDHIVMDGRSLAREFGPAGIDILVNENRRVRLPNGNVLWLAGVDDLKYRRVHVEEALSGIPKEVPKVLLAHAPDVFEKASRREINLTLVGDTHGGQVGIPILVRMSKYANRTPYIKGLFQEGNTKMYVNRGIGMKTLPIRFLCRPEIAVIKVRS